MLPAAALFIADKIIEQAAKENITMSDVERKMLLFSESSPVLPEVARANEIFGREYDSANYEAKVVGLIKHIRSSLRGNVDAVRAWNEAVNRLQGEDYYFMVMLNDAGSRVRPPGDLVKLIMTAIAVVTVVVAIIFWVIR